MQIREDDLVVAQHRTLVELWFFDLDDQIGDVENVLGAAKHGRTGLFVVGISHADAHAGARFHIDLVAVVCEFAHAGRRHADAKFECFYFFWYPDLHESLPVLMLL